MLDKKKVLGYGQGMTDYIDRIRRWKDQRTPNTRKTFAELGEACGVSGSLVCQWMGGTRTMPTEADLEALGRALGVDDQEVAAARGELERAKTQRRAKAQRRARWEKLNQEDGLVGR